MKIYNYIDLSNKLESIVIKKNNGTIYLNKNTKYYRMDKNTKYSGLYYIVVKDNNGNIQYKGYMNYYHKNYFNGYVKTQHIYEICNNIKIIDYLNTVIKDILESKYNCKCSMQEGFKYAV